MRQTIRRRVLVVWLLLAVLIGVVAITEYRDGVSSRPARDGVGHEASLLLPVPVEQLGAVEIAHAGTRHRFERDAADRWFYHGVHTGSERAHAHATDPSTATRIAETFEAFGRTRIERRLPAASEPARHGLTSPRTLILLYRRREGQPLAQYAVGDTAPDTVSRYVDVVGGGRIVTIPGYQIDNLLALIDTVRGTSARR